MSLAIHRSAAAAAAPSTATSPRAAERGAVRDLAKALRTEDMAAARAAYATILRNAPDAAQFPKGTAFADLGRALASGDISAAQAAFKSMVRGHLPRHEPGTPTPLPPQPAAMASTGLVDLVA